MQRSDLSERDIRRFEEKVARGGADECWPWLSCKNANGYGVFNLARRARRSHRIAYCIEYGECPEDSILLHSCDNPECNNPSHLRLGSRSENAADKVAKGRQSRGSMTSKRFDDSDAIAIIMSDEPASTLAERLSISPQLVRMIRRGERWKHVSGPGVEERVAVFRARQRRGEGHWRSKLTAELVVAIRRDTRSQKAIGQDYGVSASTVAEIQRREIWTHI